MNSSKLLIKTLAIRLGKRCAYLGSSTSKDDVVVLVRPYRGLSFSLSEARLYVLDGVSYLDLVVGDEDESSRELCRSAAALSLKIPARVDAADAVSAGFVALDALVAVDFTFVSSSVSDSSSELDSSSDDDSSFLAFAAAGCVEDWRNLL